MATLLVISYCLHINKRSKKHILKRQSWINNIRMDKLDRGRGGSVDIYHNIRIGKLCSVSPKV